MQHGRGVTWVLCRSLLETTEKARSNITIVFLLVYNRVKKTPGTTRGASGGPRFAMDWPANTHDIPLRHLMATWQRYSLVLSCCIIEHCALRFCVQRLRNPLSSAP